MKVVVVGAGLSGLTAAVLLKEQGHQVEVFETKDHVGGHCHDGKWQGILVQWHGPHIFHTNDLACWNFVNRYADFFNYHHVVMAQTDIGIFNIPFNSFSQAMIGREVSDEELIERVYVGYSEKMWGMAWEDLPMSITKRVLPRRKGFDVRYTTDMYHGVPMGGFNRMFTAMVEGVTVHLSAEVHDWRNRKADLVIYTGKVDEYFGFEHGRLGYRSIRFDHKAKLHRTYPIINDCRALTEWTRSTDHGFWNGQENQGGNTIVSYEYPCDHDETNDPFYPKPWGIHIELAEKYRKMARVETNVVFFGRLAEYLYLDMNMVVERALRNPPWA